MGKVDDDETGEASKPEPDRGKKHGGRDVPTPQGYEVLGVKRLSRHKPAARKR